MFSPQVTPGFSGSPAPSTSTFGVPSQQTLGTPQQSSLFPGGSTGFGTGQTGFGNTPTQPGLFGSSSFGTPTQNTGFGANVSLNTQPQASSPFSFGAPTTSSFSLSAQTTQPQLGGFSNPATTSTFGSTQPGLSLNPKPLFSTTNFQSNSPLTSATTSSSNTGAGSFGSLVLNKPLTTSASTPLFGKPAATTATSLSTSTLKGHHLGGCGSPSAPIQSVKDDLVPQELISLIEGFKGFVKDQKSSTSEVARASLKPICKVTEDADCLKQFVSKLERTLSRCRILNNKLKNDTIRGLCDCEIAQSNVDLLAGQGDNSSSLQYFNNLSERFQEQVISLRLEIENTEKHILSYLNSSPLTPQELFLSMQKLHECFVALAGRLQVVHTSMNSLKQRALDARQKKLNDFTNIFDRKPRAVKDKADFDLPLSSPTPFTGTFGYNYIKMKSSLSWQAQYHTNKPSTLGFTSPSMLSTPPHLTANTFLSSSSSNSASSDNFQLKPPPGNKRGKR